jgi:uncharacterized protein DUF4105
MPASGHIAEPTPSRGGQRPIQLTRRVLLGIGIFLLTVWATAALYFDFPITGLRLPSAASYLIGVAVAIGLTRGRLPGIVIGIVGFLVVLIWWLSIKPSNNRPWQPDVAETAWVEIQGDHATIHNLRSCEYRSEFDYTPHWETKEVDLSQIRGVDVFITYWGSAYIAHPIVSFQVGDDDHVAFSIETRKEIGESYSAILGFFRTYELIYTIADERDVVRLRTNYRSGEEVYLFRTTAGPQWARELFLQYARSANQLHEQPKWYNALTRNCTTNIFQEVNATGTPLAHASRYDWRILLPGKGDEMLYESGNIVTGGLPFTQLKAQAHINAAARESTPETFSRSVREGRVGFTPAASH